MPLDAVFLKALTRELDDELAGARIDKIFQPERDELILALRTVGGSRRLLASVNPGHARVHITESPRENPQSPPMFCMLLRKHLSGARIAGFEQPYMERVLHIAFDTVDELGAHARKTLTLELIGRHSNIILCGPDGRIIDCLRKVDHEMSERRQVLPGLFYRPPPPQDKRDFFSLDEQEIAGFACISIDENKLLDTFSGLSPLICRELVHLSGQTGIAAALSALTERYRREDFTPVMLLDGDKPFDFSYMPITQYGASMKERVFPGYSALLESFFELRESRERLRQRSQGMLKNMTTARDRLVRKLGAQRDELEATKGRERLRELGDILTSSLHLIEKSAPGVTLSDFYDPDGRDVEIKLDPRLTPQRNAAKYYKDYTKARNAENFLVGEIGRGEGELAYLDSVLDEIRRAGSGRELEEIREELISGGYLSAQGKAKGRSAPAIQPHEYLSSEGYVILAGRNNRGNDELTLKRASKSDIWLHAQKIPGCHVIIRCEGREPGPATLHEGAAIAAFYSQASSSPKVPVDYTHVKHVKKPPGARPGMVIYDEYKTVIVSPGLIQQLS